MDLELDWRIVEKMFECKHCQEKDQTKFYNHGRNQCRACYNRISKQRATKCREHDINCKLERKECEICKKEVKQENTHYFEWNHIDPAQKEYQVSHIVSKPKLYDEEIKKCNLLCLFCHADVTKQQWKDGAFRTKPRLYE